MKPFFAVLLTLLMLLCFSGCQAVAPPLAQQEPQQITVRYCTDEGNYRMITADLRCNDQSVTDYIGSTSQTSTYELAQPERLLDFLKETVIASMDSSSVSSGENAEVQIRWSVQIVTDRGNLRAEGLGSEAYPDYWQELLKLLAP